MLLRAWSRTAPKLAVSCRWPDATTWPCTNTSSPAMVIRSPSAMSSITARPTPSSTLMPAAGRSSGPGFGYRPEMQSAAFTTAATPAVSRLSVATVSRSSWSMTAISPGSRRLARSFVRRSTRAMPVTAGAGGSSGAAGGRAGGGSMPGRWGSTTMVSAATCSCSSSAITSSKEQAPSGPCQDRDRSERAPKCPDEHTRPLRRRAGRAHQRALTDPAPTPPAAAARGQPPGPARCRACPRASGRARSRGRPRPGATRWPRWCRRPPP